MSISTFWLSMASTCCSLDNVLPSGIKATLFALIPDPRARKSERINQELIDELRRSGLFDFSARAALRARDSS